MRRMQALDAEQGRDSSKNACALLRKIGKASPANSHLGPRLRMHTSLN
jgi:hypothetical protein